MESTVTWVARLILSTKRPEVIAVTSAPELQYPALLIMMFLPLRSSKWNTWLVRPTWIEVMPNPKAILKIKNGMVELKWTKAMSDAKRTTIETTITFLAPIRWVIWPATSNPKNAPIDPVLINEPKAPFSSPKFSRTSGKRGTQAMMPKPKRKKSRWISFCSRPWPISICDIA